MSRTATVIRFPAQPVLLEMRSERLPAALRALMEAGFKVSNTGRINRFRVEDAREKSR